MLQMSLLRRQQETHTLRKQTYGCQEEGIVREFGKVMYTLLYSKWITRNYCTAHGTLLNIICQPGWKRDLGENEHMYMYG